jgi:hypothetical protein
MSLLTGLLDDLAQLPDLLHSSEPGLQARGAAVWLLAVLVLATVVRVLLALV